MTVAVADDQPLKVLNYLSDLLINNKAERLLNADAVGVAGAADQLMSRRSTTC